MNAKQAALDAAVQDAIEGYNKFLAGGGGDKNFIRHLDRPLKRLRELRPHDREGND